MNWQIEYMKTLPLVGGIQDYVLECGWRCTAQDQGFTGTVYGSVSFAPPESLPGTFTPFSQLTQDQVLAWVWASGVDREATEAAVALQLHNLINPPVLQPPLPWAQPAPAAQESKQA
jgi:hypothetical protein